VKKVISGAKMERVERAAKMFEQDGKDVDEIAAEVGYGADTIRFVSFLFIPFFSFPSPIITLPLFPSPSKERV
jgi:hypothetical protein